PAIWFGLTMCDNESYPEGTKVCKPDSNSNIQVPPRPDHAGAAFTELQFYPPGYAPAISCDHTHWCAALTIDTLQAQFGALPGPPPDEDPPCFTGPVIPGCLGSDADFDGFPYHADWPNGSAAFPTPNLLSSPHSLNRVGFETGTYPTARFETDLPRIEEANNG